MPTLVVTTTLGAGGGGAGGTTPAVNTTGATLLVISASWWQGNVFFSDSKGNTWIQATKRTGGVINHQYAYCLTPTVGTGHTFTVTGGSAYPAVIVHAFSGTTGYVLQTQDGTGVATGASPLAAGSVTPASAAATLLLSGYAANNGTIPPGLAVTAGFTTVPSEGIGGTAFPGVSGYYVPPTTAAINPTWSWTGGGAYDTAVSVLAFSPGPAATLRLTQVVTESLTAQALTPAFRLTQAAAETLTGQAVAPAFRLTQLVVESLTPTTPPPPTTVFRKTLSGLGTRTGARRLHWR